VGTDQSHSSTRASFEINAETADETLIAGLSQFGLAGLTAVDYLVDHLEFEPVGNVTAEQLPAITPFKTTSPRTTTANTASRTQTSSRLGGGSSTT